MVKQKLTKQEKEHLGDVQITDIIIREQFGKAHIFVHKDIKNLLNLDANEIDFHDKKDTEYFDDLVNLLRKISEFRYKYKNKKLKNEK